MLTVIQMSHLILTTILLHPLIILVIKIWQYYKDNNRKLKNQIKYCTLLKNWIRKCLNLTRKIGLNQIPREVKLKRKQIKIKLIVWMGSLLIDIATVIQLEIVLMMLVSQRENNWGLCRLIKITELRKKHHLRIRTTKWPH